MNVEKTEVTFDDLEKINKFTRTAMTENDVYTFKMVCCDTKVDRDGEVFSVNALKKLAELYIGKTVITNHEPKAENQIARIYKTDVIEENGVSKLLAWAYLPKTESNTDLISEIDSGIKKEVSVGCSVKGCKCSVCGKQIAYCGHKKNKEYNSKLCYGILDDVTDAYEVSFVAVPAQIGAGVTKSFKTILCSDTSETEVKIKLAEAYAYCTQNSLKES